MQHLLPPRWAANCPRRPRFGSRGPEVSTRRLQATAQPGPAHHSDQKQRPLDVIVIGAGIGGLTAAAALLETGARVRVFESRSKEAALTGPGGIFFQANAEKVLRLLESPWPGDSARLTSGAAGSSGSPGASTLSDAVVTVGGPIMSGGFRDEAGKYLYYADVTSTGLKDLQSNGLTISRRSCQNIFYSALPAGCVSFNRRLRAFSAPPAGEPGKVKVSFEDGGEEECDVLVGADGIRSKVRQQLAGGPVELRYSGTVCWRGQVPLSRVGGGAEWYFKLVNNDSWAEYWGKGLRMGMFDVGSEVELDEHEAGGLRRTGERQLGWYAFANLPDTWKPEPGADEAARLRAMFKDYASPVPELFAAVDPASIHVGPVWGHTPLAAPWGAGRVTLLGDAVHAMQPTLGQGGCMAIEDSLELANELAVAVAPTVSSSSSSGSGAATSGLSGDQAAVGALEEALRRYEASRAPRVARVLEQSNQIAELAMMDSDFSVWMRNTIYRLTPKWAGDKQFEYLYKDYIPAWKEGARLGRSWTSAGPAAPTGSAAAAAAAAPVPIGAASSASSSS